ncbi:MAG: class II aldolase/adducin family protein [Candidatus Lokiarchaeota archaeon]|nr:class II aldolase/adducin family protein [Candidatus Lokiarchaeota archaeon]
MKALVTAEFSEEALRKLREILSDEVIYESWRDKKHMYFDPDVLTKKIHELGVEIFICEGDNLKKNVIENTNLKIIGSIRGDPNNIDILTATKKKIPILFAPNRNTIAVAELTLTLIFALLKKLHSVDRIIHSKRFSVEEFSDYVTFYNKFQGRELTGKTIGIVGLGRIGFQVAKFLKPFNVTILIYDPYVLPQRLSAINGKSVDLQVLLKSSDIITIHCPPTDETDGLIGEAEIELMKSSALFINLARASVIDESALFDALKEKKIAGAALDVFASEPVDHENEFLQLDNVIVTPHIAGDTYETTHRGAMMIVDGIKTILDHQVPLNIKNPEVLTGIKPTEQDSSEDNTDISISLDRYKGTVNEIIRISQEMLRKGFVIGTAGNISARVKLPNGKNAVIITPSSVDYTNLQSDDFVIIDMFGNKLVGTRNPSSERRLHLAIYRERSDINAIIHSHAPFSTALSIAKMPLGPFVDEIIPFIGGCEISEFGMAGTDELAENGVKALGDNMAAMIANHGNVGCGSSLEQAWFVCELVEFAAKIQYRAATLGTMYAIPEEAEESEKEMYAIMKDMNI